MSIGKDMYDLCAKIYPICRSISGDGVRRTFDFLREIVPAINLHEVPTGTKVFDWEVPKEWNIRDAWIKDHKGGIVVDFKDSNLHVVSYSVPVNRYVSLAELNKVIYTLPDMPDAIPNVISYYQERYGFCMTEEQRSKMEEGTYHIYIDSDLKNGSLTYGDLIIPGESDREIFLSTYICHPSLGNDNLSGIAVTLYLAKWVLSLPNRYYTYRVCFVPETIGSITYLSQNNNLQWMQRHMDAGFNIGCVGDDRSYCYVESRYGNTLADKVAQNALRFHYPAYKHFSFLDRSSDDRQYCAPGVDLPVCSVTRTKWGEYPEYHTSKDNLDVISPCGLYGAYKLYQKMIYALEHSRSRYKVQCLCEPWLSKRGLRPSVNKAGRYGKEMLDVKVMSDFLAYADGKNDLIDISNRIDVPVEKLCSIADRLIEAGVIAEVK